MAMMVEIDEPYHSSCQKLLFSATLTHDPSKIIPLGLRDPRYFVVGDRTGVGAAEETFAFPATLSVRTQAYPPTQLRASIDMFALGTHVCMFAL